LAYPNFAAATADAGWLAESVRYVRIPAGPHLKRVQIEVALRCNLQCSYCYSVSGPAERTALTGDEVRDILRQSAELGVLSVDFTGGEFFLDPDWESYLQLTNSLGIAFTLHTNGTTLTPRVIEKLRLYLPDVVQVSIDSHEEFVHDQARGKRGALRRTLQGLDRLAVAGMRTRISLMAHRDNLSTIGLTAAYLADRYPRAQINLDRVVAVGGAVQAGNGISARQFWDVVTPLRSNTVTTNKVCESPLGGAFEPECGMAYSYVYITASGEIAACPTMTGREEGRFLGPNIREHSLGDAWYRSAFFNSFRGTNCMNVRSCPSGSTCGGGCRSRAYTETGDVNAPDVVACNLNKNPGKTFIDYLSLYQRVAAPQ
jgi:pyrroloquinoline quinone biosynthesis protein E